VTRAFGFVSSVAADSGCRSFAIGAPWTERSGGPASHLLYFVDKTPDGPRHMGNRKVDTAFPENLRDPVDPQAATKRLQDLFLILSQCLDRGLLSITAAVRAARDFEKILSSGFERIRLSQCESPSRPDEIENTIL
jgi:hypothetical protein